jgi:hypothetical protein
LQNFNSVLSTGTLISDISDHFSNIICIPSSNGPKTSTNKVEHTGSLTLPNLTNFRNDPWKPKIVYHCDF